MSTRHNNGSHYENHQRAAELRDIAAHAHRTGTEHRGQQDHLTAHEQSTREREHAEQIFRHESGARHQVAVEKADGPPPSQEDIALRAYRLWQARGCPQGSPEVDWFAAVEQLRASSL